jgi:hypothetical protein
MKLKFQLTIDGALDEVWATFDNPNNMRRWQPNLKSFAHKSRDPGQTDAISELVYDENGSRIVMAKTITERREPVFLAGVYDTKWGKTLVVNHVEKVDDNTTSRERWCNFTFKGFMKIMSLFFAGSISRRTESDMQRFKLIVETDIANAAQ